MANAAVRVRVRMKSAVRRTLPGDGSTTILEGTHGTVVGLAEAESASLQFPGLHPRLKVRWDVAFTLNRFERSGFAPVIEKGYVDDGVDPSDVEVVEVGI